MSALLMRVVHDENGTEVVEYALTLGMIVLACLTILGMLGVKILGRWQDIYNIL